MLKLRNILISVADLEESKRWYAKNLGFHTEREQWLPPLEADIAMLSNGALTLELACCRQRAMPLPEERRFPRSDVQTVGTKHFSLLVDDMDALLAHLRANNTEIMYTVEIGADRVAMIRDCSGITIELVQEG